MVFKSDVLILYDKTPYYKDNYVIFWKGCYLLFIKLLLYWGPICYKWKTVLAEIWKPNVTVQSIRIVLKTGGIDG